MSLGARLLVALGVTVAALVIASWVMLGCSAGNAKNTPQVPVIDKLILSVDGVNCPIVTTLPDGKGGAAVTVDCGDGNLYTVQEPVWP